MIAMDVGVAFRRGYPLAFVVTAGLSIALFLGSHAGTAFDRAFFPILGVGVGVGIILAIVRATRPMGWGIVAGTVSSLVVLASLTSILLVLGVGT
jgi:hypothetical protein